VIVILGPTAGGKSDLAMELARRLDGEIVSADSMQVYRGMDIGTAKPTPAERAEIPHHGIDLVDAREEGFTVARWLRAADEAIADIEQRGRTAIVVGGTNLYIRAFLEGLDEAPAADAAFRASLESEESTPGSRRATPWRRRGCMRTTVGGSSARSRSRMRRARRRASDARRGPTRACVPVATTCSP